MVEQNPQSAETHETSKSEFVSKLEARWQQGTFVCVGLDSDFSQIPQSLKDATPTTSLSANLRDTHIEEVMFRFNQQIVDSTHDLVCAYKPNAAFYEAQGDQGLRALARTIRYIKEQHPDIPVILDVKRADLGKDALEPFLARKDKGIIVLVRTSNPGAGEFQDLYVSELIELSTTRLYKYVATKVSKEWNENENVGIVVGATYPTELAHIRKIVGDMPILIPGVGAQGGEVEATVTSGKDSRGWGMIINSSRGIIFASKGEDFAQAARKAAETLRGEVNKYR